MDWISFVSFLLYSSQSSFWCHHPFQSQSRGLSMVISGAVQSSSNTHERSATLTAPSAQSPSFRAGDTYWVFPFMSSRPNPRPALVPKAFFKRLNQSVGMSQERWAISLGRNTFTDGWVAFVCLCVCMLICVYFTSIKPSPGCWDHVFLNILGHKVTSQGSVTASWLWEWAAFIKQKSKQQERDETKNIITPPQWKIMFPLDMYIL